ncbi:O-antigen ligase family protein [Puniceicoccaceae bacterium K14]|nr:O-antigen ligase family protein [Puniceicoccaceae bacterium K14]
MKTIYSGREDYYSRKIFYQLMLLLASVYAIGIAGARHLAIPSVVLPLGIMASIAYVWVATTHLGLARFRTNSIHLILVFAFLGIINCLLAMDPKASAMPWCLWLCLFSLMEILKDKLRYLLISTIEIFPIALSIFLVFSVAVGWGDFGVGTKSGQVWATYAGPLVIFSLFSKSKYRYIYLAIGVLSLIGSVSRGAMISLALSLSFIGYMRKGRKPIYLCLVPVAIIALFASGIAQDIIRSFFAIKILRPDQTAMDDLSLTTGYRFNLWVEGVKLIAQRPFGYGLGDSYHALLGAAVGKDSGRISVHNGYITTILETGVIIGGLMISIISISAYRVFKIAFRNRLRPAQYIFGFYIFYMTRAMTENYLIFNTGNITSIIFIYFIFYSLKYKTPNYYESNAHERV